MENQSFLRNVYKEITKTCNVKPSMLSHSFFYVTHDKPNNGFLNIYNWVW